MATTRLITKICGDASEQPLWVLEMNEMVVYSGENRHPL